MCIFMLNIICAIGTVLVNVVDCMTYKDEAGDDEDEDADVVYEPSDAASEEESSEEESEESNWSAENESSGA